MSMDDATLLFAHAEDLGRRALAGELCYTAFLTPQAQKRLSRQRLLTPVLFAGGYAQAERARCFFLPPWLQELEQTARQACLQEVYDTSLVALEITGSSYRDLSHRDYLGAILNLGLERSAIGDLCVTSPHTALLFCDGVIADFLRQNLTRVANDAIHVRTTVPPPDFDGGRRFQSVSDTVASPRADSIVAALANLSRERARALFSAGHVEIDYEIADKPDRVLQADTVIVIRGVGKFLLRSLSDLTKKGRYRLLADRYL